MTEFLKTDNKRISRKIGAFDLRIAFTQVAAVPFIMLMLLAAVMCLWQGNMFSALGKMRLDMYDYIFLGENSVPLILFILFAGGLVAGITAFRFFNSVRMSNVFLSMNITRARLYFNRAVSSLICLTGAVTLPFLICFFRSSIELGFSGSALGVWFYLLSGMLTCAFVGFAFGALGSVCSGDVLESCVNSTAFIFAPSVLFMGLEAVMDKLLRGYAFTFFDIYESSKIPALYRSGHGLFANTLNFNPLFWFGSGGDISGLSELCYRYSDYPPPLNGTDIAGVALWAAVSLVIIFLAGAVALRRRAENAGVPAVNRIAHGITLAVFSFAAFALTLYAIGKKSLTAVLIALLAGAAVYVMLKLIVIRRPRELKRGIIQLPVMIGCFAVMSIIFATGMFGYSTYIPEAEDIAEAYITSAMTDGIVFSGPENTDYGTLSGKAFNILIHYSYPLSGPYKTEADIIKVINANKTAIEGEDENRYLTVIYKMKDGGTVKRMYYCTSGNTSDALTGLALSDYAAQAFEYALVPHDGLTDELAEKNDTRYNLVNNFSYADASRMYFVGKDGIPSGLPVSDIMTEDEFAELKACMYRDQEKLGFTERFYPKGEFLFMVTIAVSNNAWRENSSAIWSGGSMLQTSTLTVTSHMTETLGYVTEKGWDIHYDSERRPIAAIVISEDRYKENVIGYYGDIGSWEGFLKEKLYIMYAAANVFEKSELSDIQSMLDSGISNGVFYGADIITEATAIEALYSASQPMCIMNGEGRMARFVFDDGSVVNLYIPHYID